MGHRLSLCQEWGIPQNLPKKFYLIKKDIHYLKIDGVCLAKRATLINDSINNGELQNKVILSTT